MEPDLLEAIPASMRLFSIEVDEVSGISKKLKPGDWVDVIATTVLPDERKSTVSRIILQGIQVLDSSLSASEGEVKGIRNRGRGKWTVSLLVSLEQATTLAAAAESSDIRLLGRNANEARVAVDPGAMAFTPEAGMEPIAGYRRDLNRSIPVGMRGVTLLVRDTDGTLGLIESGDRVDVIVTSPWSKFSTQGETTAGAAGIVTETRISSRTLLQDIEVLATEEMTEVDVGLESPVRRVTLLVTLAEAERLAVISDATKKSVIRLVSRNADDRGRLPTGGAALIDILSQKHPYHQVEVIRGIKRDAQRFYR